VSGGLTSYPRTDGPGGDPVLQCDNYLAELRTGIATDKEYAALQLIHALEALAKENFNVSPLEERAREATQVLFRLQDAGELEETYYVRALVVAAKCWAEINPIEETLLWKYALECEDQLKAAVTDEEKRDAIERAGSISAMYTLCAHAGRDLTSTHFAAAVTLNNSKYSATYDGDTLIFLECGAAYSTNIYVSIPMPGAQEHMILTAEAKGGTSGNGKAYGPAFLLSPLGKVFVKQNEALYQASRGYYMRRSGDKTEVGVAKREAGDRIVNAFGQGTHVALLARGRIVDGKFECKLGTLAK
jgi:hypothetical protein